MTSPSRSVIVHGHFYQPPRDDPWLGEVPREATAHPYHDWNERVTRECYRAVTAARLPTGDGRIARIVNTLESMSFDVGPTLLTWLEAADPQTHAAIVEADRHRNAIATPYHHVILPFATRRDKLTEVRWGIADFRRRFGRDPEGMWLPETAVDDETLDVLAEAGVRFTILAPHQVSRPPDAGAPGIYRTASGRTIAVFVYDGPLSHDVAFGGLLRDAVAWERRIAAVAPPAVVTIATDGETYGHHHRFGEMALAALLDRLARRPDACVEPPRTVLDRTADLAAVELVAPSSWSCPHGVERWREACGCKAHPEIASRQEWRRPLRDALEWLRDTLDERFASEGAALFTEPSRVRDDYGAQLGDDEAATAFVRAHTRGDDATQRRRAAELLEMARHALAMFTSCGWFFDDVGGVESRIVLRHAACAIDLCGDATLHDQLARRLARAHSNDPSLGDGARIYRSVRPRFDATIRVAAGAAAARALGADPGDAVPPAYLVEPDGDAMTVRHRRTGRVRRLHAEVERRGTAHITVAVADDATGRSLVELDDLPETARAVVARGLSHDTITEWFSDDERRALAAGDGLPAVAARALDRSVAALSDDASATTTTRVLALLDLFDLRREPFPYETQSRFYRIWCDASDDRRSALDRIRDRLGFA